MRSIVLRRLFTFATLAGPCLGLNLQPETLQAWHDYLTQLHQRVDEYHRDGGNFLWVDGIPGARERLKRGEILTAPWEGAGLRPVPHGLIHHWVGAAFIPGVRVEDVLAITHDYDHYKEYYKASGVVAESKLLEHRGDHFRFLMRWVKRVLWVTAAVEAEYEGLERTLGQNRRYGLAWSTRIREIRHFGEPGEQLLPPDTGSGYMWRLFSVARYQQEPDGVIVELEALVLSRNIPPAFRWLVGPIVNRLSRNSMLLSLKLTREAVLNRKKKLQTGAAP